MAALRRPQPMSLDLDTTKIRTQASRVAIPRQGPCCLRGLFFKGWRYDKFQKYHH